MKRTIITTVLLLLLLESLGVTALLLLTPAGGRVLSTFAPAPTPTPVLTAHGTPPTVNAAAAYVLDADTDRTLIAINSQKRLPMASTTKIMTALLALQKGRLDQPVTIQQDAVDEVQKNQGSSAQLVVGDQIPLRDLLYGLMLPSGDDAAIAIADSISGSPTNFVKLMNNSAHQLHLKHTHYINPDGLTYMTPQAQPDPNHYTTAADLAQLARIALQNPLFAQIVQLQRYSLPPSATHHAYTWSTTDDLLSGYPGVLGVKTGYTVEAGYCLVFAATRAGHDLVGVLLHDSDTDPNARFSDAATLLDWSFALPLQTPPQPAT